MDPLQPTADVLNARIWTDVKHLIQHYENILAATMKDNPSHVSTATDNYKLDLESTSLVHYVEDILSLTRTLKEVWLFGKLNTVGQDERDVKRQQAVEGDWKAMLDMLEANAPLAPATIPEKVDMDEGDEVQGEVKDEEMDGQAEEAQEQSFPDPMETVNSEAL